MGPSTQLLIMGLKLALEAKVYALNVYSDSQLLIRQMNLEYEVRKPNLLPYFNWVQAILPKNFRVRKFHHHVPQQSNIKADTLVGCIHGFRRE